MKTCLRLRPLAMTSLHKRDSVLCEVRSDVKETDFDNCDSTFSVEAEESEEH